jgi:hypothetical protein
MCKIPNLTEHPPRGKGSPMNDEAAAPTQEFTTKDSGQREVFKTGSQRDMRKGKGRFDLLPYPAMLRVAQLYERGAEKYLPRNWEQGQPFSRVLDSAIRHIMQWSGGDRSEDHLAACAWNCFALMSYEQWIKEGVLPEELNDLEDAPDPGIYHKILSPPNPAPYLNPFPPSRETMKALSDNIFPPHNLTTIPDGMVHGE